MTKRKLLNQNVLFFLISLLGLFIFSCKNPLAQSQENQLSKETVKLKISTNLARTVLPTQFNAGTSGLTWTLTGIKDGASTSTRLGSWSDEENTTAYSKMTSTEISVDVGTWNFTLDVTNSSDKKVLTGTTGSIDVSTNSTLTFVMQEPTEGVVAPGQIEFKLNFPSGVVGKVEATLTEYGNAATPVGSGQVTLSTGEVDASVTYKNTVSAGTYMLKLDLQQKDPAEASQQVYETINTYTCLIRVAPGLCSTGTETLTSLAKLYKITYELNEGTINPNVTITSYNKYTKFKLPTPIRNGYTFLGWCTDEICPNESCEHLQADTTILISQDTTLYAKWQEQQTSPEPSDQTNGLSYFSKQDDSGDNIECLNIHTAQGLALYRDIVNGTLTEEISFYKNNYLVKTIKTTNTGRIDAYLMTDITVEDWIPIGIYNADDTASNKLYSSNFYGNGYTITISSVNSSATNVGLFGYAGNYESPNTISNLIVKGDFSTVTPKYAGGIVSYAMGVNIENCVNYATIKATFSAGGIVGYIGTSNNSSNYIKKCINLGQIQQNTTNAYYGGIAGFASSTVNISDCINLKDLPFYSLGNTSGIVFVDTNVTSSIERCINVGKSACPSAYAIANSGVNSNCYYNSETTYGGQSFSDNSEKVIPKTTAELCTLNSDYLSNEWSFAAEGGPSRYPLPNLSEVYTVWSAIESEAEVDLPEIEVPEEIPGTEVTSLTELSNAIANTAIEVIVIAGNIEVTETLDITRDVTILANENFTLTHKMTSDNLFWIAPDTECVFTLGGGAGELIITGDANFAAITTNSSKITINIKENVTFTGLDHYAISVVNPKTTLNINGGKFDYNNYSPINVSDSAIIYFNSGSISNNSFSGTNITGSINLREGTLTIGEKAICKNNTNVTYTYSGSLIWVGSSATATLNGEELPTNTLYENNIGG